MQQHNYQRTYLFGEGIELPPDRRIIVDVAARSNELYPHVAGRTRRRAVCFLDHRAMRYLLGYGPRPSLSACDVTDAAREAAYRLEFLPPRDAFYSFQGSLGEPRLLPGRDGPPGADYNTLPGLKPWPIQWFLGYWRENNGADRRRFERTIGEAGDYVGFARAQRRVFFDNWACLRAAGQDCRLE